MRERLTITLKQEILDALDAAIDGDRLRNRSHAIEYYLSKSLGQKALKVLILAGGKAVDFGSSGGGTLPKTMVKIAGRPLLEQTLLKLKAAKFREVIISISEGGNTIKEYFKNGQALGLSIRYIEQNEKISGTAQALFQAKEMLGQGNFLLLYGDVLCDIDYADLMQFHSLHKAAVCTMALTSTESPNMWGLAKMQGSKIVDFEEKPKVPKTFSRLVNAGVYLMEPEIFKYIGESAPLPNPPYSSSVKTTADRQGEGKKKAVKLESDVFPRLAQEGKLYGYLYEGLWLDISSSAAYKQAVREIIKN